MRVTILAIGSRGDVQPYVALGAGFKNKGAQVTVAAYPDFAGFIAEYGLRHVPLAGDPKKVLAGGLSASGRNPSAFWRRTLKEAGFFSGEFAAQCVTACTGAELILFSPLGIFARDIGKHLRIPAFLASYLPVTPTAAFPNAFFPELPAWLPFKRIYNRLTYLMEIQIFWHHFRKASGGKLPLLAPFGQIASDRSPIFYGFSTSVIPRPDDWGDWIHPTGYWFLDPPSGWEPSRELKDFLSAGEPPVYFGFGSVIGRNPEQTADLILKALSISGRRGIIAAGWGGIAKDFPLPENVLAVDAVPHGWLFPRMAAVVHHGGAGTTAAGLAGGVPSILVPAFADQFFWGDRVAKLGAGPKPIPRARLTPRALARAIGKAISDEKMRARARKLGERIREEDGVSVAVDAITREAGTRGQG